MKGKLDRLANWSQPDPILKQVGFGEKTNFLILKVGNIKEPSSERERSRSKRGFLVEEEIPFFAHLYNLGFSRLHQ
ncbi:hypothetical protein F8388_026241 [Cannabis sativa]|uniref:Uncharacterized protein n=1 Tax=Cannabis sativa TaxID=3483 RepID=A0A7J6E130_CANSA|nr:hypothetical protein F8388_026241 [Cannabis sativa]